MTGDPGEQRKYRAGMAGGPGWARSSCCWSTSAGSAAGSPAVYEAEPAARRHDRAI
jgi:hypothetical protein